MNTPNKPTNPTPSATGKPGTPAPKPGVPAQKPANPSQPGKGAPAAPPKKK